MTTLLIGHRGVGKTQLLTRLKSYLPSAETLDLDALIESQTGKSISQIFADEGEAAFRKLEKVTLLKTLQNPAPLRFIALGAGFDLSFLDGLNVKILWVRRKTDSLGRVFLNRPPLNKELSPFDDYIDRFSEREKNYSKIYDESLILPEGLDFENQWEKSFFQNTFDLSGASLGLLPPHFRKLDTYLKKRTSWNLDYLEFRDDLLSERRLEELLPYKNKFKILYSFRKDPGVFEKIHGLGLHYDWPLEWGLPPKDVDFLSLHSLNSDFYSELGFLKKIESSAKLKFAPVVSDFKELLAGHQWFLKNPQKHVFLPRGRAWHWYRLFMKGKMSLNFIREDDGTSLEQPTLMQWLMVPWQPKEFSAVLGDPVLHSRSPVEHHELEAFFDIQIKKEEWDAALEVLKELGLKNAAITSPLKENAGGANTLKITDKIEKTNTDIPALFTSMPEFIEEKVAIWGGGGTLPAIENRWPKATFYSAREAKPRHGEEINPDVVVWAAGRSSDLKSPPQNWKPKKVVDLNYAENSPGLEFAIRTGAEYVSGLGMFKEQARLQKEFWK